MPEPLPSPPSVPELYLSNLQERIGSNETLNSQAQMALVFELEAQLRDGRSPTEIRDLLLRLKRRDDLLDKVGREIDATLRNLNGSGGNKQPSEHPEPGWTASAESHRPVEPGQLRMSNAKKLCPQCRTPVSAEASFCSSCGTTLLQQTGSRVPPSVPPKNGSRKTRAYACTRYNSPGLIADVKSWLEAQDFDCQQMSTESDTVLLQIKKRGGWRDSVGMSTALNIVFHQSEHVLTVEIGAGKWMDKAAAGTVSMFILWPLAVTAAKGAWDQWWMPDRIFDQIATQLASA